jgi:probable addiction module antidote protein
MIETTKWNVAEHLDNEERIALFLEAVFEDGDPRLIASAIGEVTKARARRALTRRSQQ